MYRRKLKTKTEQLRTFSYILYTNEFGLLAAWTNVFLGFLRLKRIFVLIQPVPGCSFVMARFNPWTTGLRFQSFSVLRMRRGGQEKVWSFAGRTADLSEHGEDAQSAQPKGKDRNPLRAR